MQDKISICRTEGIFIVRIVFSLLRFTGHLSDRLKFFVGQNDIMPVLSGSPALFAKADKWVVLRRELGRNTVGKKSVTEELEWGIVRIRGGLKSQPHQFRGDFAKTLELYCSFFRSRGHPVATVCFYSNRPMVWVEKSKTGL